MIVEHTVEIERPIEQVFEVATCTRRCVVWVSVLSNSQMDSDEPVHVGSTFSSEADFGDQTHHLNGVITELDPPHRLYFKLVESFSLVSLTFAPSEQGTTFRMAVELERGMGKFEDPSQLKAAIKRRFQKNMGHLKSLLESDVDLWDLTPA